MVRIQLKRSGGQLGKTLQSATEVDMPESELMKSLLEVVPRENPMARDAFHYSITLNGQTFPIDIARLKGTLKKVVHELDENLKL